MLKIWGRTTSINVQKVLWCCGELNVQYERIDAGMAFGIGGAFLGVYPGLDFEMLPIAFAANAIPGPRMFVSTRAFSATGMYPLLGYSWELNVPEGVQVVDGPDDVGRGGRLLPSTSADAYFAELLRWFGVPAGSMSYVLPNIASMLIVQATIQFAVAILAEAGLSYLGLGAQPPVPSWGRMLRDAQTYIFQAPELAVWPGLAIALAVLGLNMLGDGLRDLLDPRLRLMRVG